MSSQQEQLEAILNSCPYRQHSKECKTFHKAMLSAQPAITALIQEAVNEGRVDENVRLRRRYNGTNYEKLRATLNYRINQLSGGSNNE